MLKKMKRDDFTISNLTYLVGTFKKVKNHRFYSGVFTNHK